jgi:hypothetical protein
MGALRGSGNLTLRADRPVATDRVGDRAVIRFEDSRTAWHHGDVEDVDAMGVPCGPWRCPACSHVLRADDSVVVVRLRPFHAACAEASFSDPAEWQHDDATTLSQWARGIAWRSGA